MIVQGSNQPVDAEGAPVQAISPSIGTEDHRKATPPSLVSDQVSVSDFARIVLLMPPRDTAHLDELQQKVYSGEYGPPAAIIAEALITRAILSGVSASS